MNRPATAVAATMLVVCGARAGSPAKAAPAIAVEEDAAPAKPPPPPAAEERAAIGEEVRRHADQIQGCYAKALDRAPLLFGMVVAEFDIGPTGKVIGATANGIADRDLLVCIVQAVRTWQFNKPLSGGKLRVRYPWKLEPRPSAPPAKAAAPAAPTQPTAAR